MDDILISLNIGRTILPVLGLLLLLVMGAGIVMALLMHRRMMQMIAGATAPAWRCCEVRAIPVTDQVRPVAGGVAVGL